MRKLVLAAVVLCTVASSAPAARHVLPRATEDRPDDVRGPQLHVVYAVPADGEDRALDTTGAIERSVRHFTQWLAAETGGPTLRVDTSGGELDITFVRLLQTDAELAARGAFVRDGIEDEVRQRGLLPTRPDRIYAVYYDGTSTYACGGAFRPPATNGSVIAMYLRGLPAGPTPCATHTIGGGAPNYWEYSMLHDILHGLGLVATCAPNHTLAGHTSDFRDDLMWAGSGVWQLPPRLDVGRDDYFGHGRSDCADLARSPYLTSNPPPSPVLEVEVTVDKPRAGRRFEARADILWDGSVPAEASIGCAARVGATRLRSSASYSGGAGRCRWMIPKNARGKRLIGGVTVRVAGATVTRAFRARVR